MQPGLQPDSVQGAGRYRSADLLPPSGWLLNSVPSWPAPAVVWLDRGMAIVLQVRVPTTARPVPATMGALAVITIGIDPHKASLTAVAVDASGTRLGRCRLLVHAGTLGQLLAWAAGWPSRRFAVEGAYGPGTAHRPAAGRRRRTGPGRTGHPGRPGAAAWQRRWPQDRRRCGQRRPGRPALPNPACGGRRGPDQHPAAAGRTPRRPGRRAHPHPQPPPWPVARPAARRRA